MGTTHHVSIAPPVRMISVTFIAISMETIEIKLIPKAVLIALRKEKLCLKRIIVSRIMLVINPLIIAKIIIFKVGQAISFI
jgi:hypothetical protein